MSKKIRFKDVKAGMIIKGDRHYGLVAYIKPAGEYDSFFLGEPCVEMYSIYGDDCDIGHSTYDPKDKVEVLTGKTRAKLEFLMVRSLRSRVYNQERYLRKFEVLVELSNPKKKKKKF